MTTTIGDPSDSSVEAARMPTRPRIPAAVQALGYVAYRRRMIRMLSARCGAAFTLQVPVFGTKVIVTDPALAKQVFSSSPDVLGNIQPNLSRVFGPGPVFALEGAEHRRRRRILTPPFHGRTIRHHEKLVEEEAAESSTTLQAHRGLSESWKAQATAVPATEGLASVVAMRASSEIQFRNGSSQRSQRTIQMLRFENMSSALLLRLDLGPAVQGRYRRDAARNRCVESRLAGLHARSGSRVRRPGVGAPTGRADHRIGRHSIDATDSANAGIVTVTAAARSGPADRDTSTSRGACSARREWPGLHRRRRNLHNLEKCCDPA